MARAKAPKDPRLQGVLFVPLVVSVLIALALGAGVIVGAYWLVKEYLGIDDQPFSQAQAATAAFATATAAGAVVALVVGVRKQGLSEQVARRELTSAFTERFRAAASQLGGTSPAERIAGVYAMAALADDYPGRAQQCVDVLCGYLRLPFDPESNTLASGSIDSTRTFANGKTVAIHRRIAARPFDQQVRETIVTVIREHLVPPANDSSPRATGLWSQLSFDLDGALLHNADFSSATFSGDSTSFDNATFSGDVTNFDSTTFDGTSNFSNATFSGNVYFDGATFSGNVYFDGATFSGITYFGHVTFSKRANFDDVSFSGVANFHAATFAGDITDFDDATFSGKGTYFSDATFSGEHAYFRDSTFSGEHATFDRILISRSIAFDEAVFENVQVTFDDLHPADSAHVTGLREPNLVGSASITSDGKQFRGWPPEDPEHSPTDVN